MTAMYRPPKLAWMHQLMETGRARGLGRTTPATASGVRVLIKALKSGEATIILPDQAPSTWESVWAPFFNRLAYTMTLAPRLAQVRGVTTLFFIDERLPGSQGCSVHIEPLAHTFSGNKRQNVELLSAQLETIIRRFQS